MDGRRSTASVHYTTMKTSGGLKTKAEETFTTAVPAVLLLLLPLCGATVMLAASVIALFAYIVWFREQLRRRGWITIYLAFAVAGAVAAVIAVGASLRRGYWL